MEQKIVVSLTAAHGQAVEQAVLCRDADAALDVLAHVVHLQVQKALIKRHCRPVFKMERGSNLTAIKPPPLDKAAGK